MRKVWGMLALFFAGIAVAQGAEHRRGEFRFWVEPVPAFVEERTLAEEWDPKAPGASDAPWRFWLHEQQVDRRTGHDVEYIDYAYEARDASLLGEAGRFQITFNPGYQRLVLHGVSLRRNGQWLDRLAPEQITLARREEGFEQDLADGNVTALLVLADVRVADVVRIRYSIVGSNPVLAGQLVDGHVFGWKSPVLESRLRVLYPPGREPRIRRENDAPEPVIRSTTDATEIRFVSTGNRAHVDEGDYPAWYRPYPAVQLSQDRRWADVVAWALPLYPPVEEPLPGDLEQHLARWAALPPVERMAGALRLVQDEVRYFGVEMGDSTHRPAAPADTWNRRYGDCKDKAYLLSTLLRRLGIGAAPALVSVHRGRGVADFPPAASVFDHVVVRAELGDEVIWIDPTRSAEGGSPRDSDLATLGLGLPIMAGVNALETIASPAEPKSGVEVNERYEVADEGRSTRLFVETVYRGRSADQRRQELAGTRPEDLSRRYADYYRRRFGELEVAMLPKIADDRVANALTVAEEYRLQAPFQRDGDLRMLDVQADALMAAASLPDVLQRGGPLDAGQPGRYRHAIEVQLPARWTSTLGDETRTIEGDAFAFERGLTVLDGRVRLNYDLKVRAREVGAKQVGPHLEKMREVQDYLSARIPLRMPADGRSADREARLKALLRKAIEEETQ